MTNILSLFLRDAFAKGSDIYVGNAKFEEVEYHLAEIYDKGLGVPEDKEKAANLYQEAARINDEWINAINNLQMRA